MKTLTVFEMVEQRLRADGYDGLYSPSECACLVEDLAPCGQIQEDCTAGYRVNGCDPDCGLGCDWHIQAAKPEEPTE